METPKNRWNLFKVNNKERGTVYEQIWTYEQISHILWCFHCWLWVSKCQLGRNQTRNLLPVLHIIKKSTKNKKVIFYIIYLPIYKIYKYIFFASPIRVQEFINKNENKKIAVNSCTFLNPNSAVLNLTKTCKTSMKTPMAEYLLGQIAGCRHSPCRFIL